VKHLLGDGDLLQPGGFVGGASIGFAAKGCPRPVAELQPAIVPITGVGAPVTAALTLCQAIPLLVQGRLGRRPAYQWNRHSDRDDTGTCEKSGSPRHDPVSMNAHATDDLTVVRDYGFRTTEPISGLRPCPDSG
jgi:hypothetical protein